jgi:hypothetical protein
MIYIKTLNINILHLFFSFILFIFLKKFIDLYFILIFQALNKQTIFLEIIANILIKDQIWI